MSGLYPSKAAAKAGAPASEMTEVNARRVADASRGTNNYRERLMEHHYHAVVWIDHEQARVFHFNADDAEKSSSIPSGRCATIHHGRSADRASR